MMQLERSRAENGIWQSANPGTVNAVPQGLGGIAGFMGGKGDSITGGAIGGTVGGAVDGTGGGGGGAGGQPGLSILIVRFSVLTPGELISQNVDLTR
jgi:hypothetical protein